MPPFRRSRSKELTVQARVQGAGEAAHGLETARSLLGSRLNSELEQLAKRIVLPKARRYAPVRTGRLRASLAIEGGTGNRVYLTSRAGARVGVLEFGGTVKAPIGPRRGKALLINGQFVSRMSKPRHYREQGFMRRAVKGSERELEDALHEIAIKAFRDANFDTEAGV